MTKYYKLDALQVKVECRDRNEVPRILGFASFQEMRDEMLIDNLHCKEISKEEYEDKNDYYERY